MSTFTHTASTHRTGGARRRGLWAMLAAMITANRQRTQLRDLDDSMLRDLGLTRAEADAESRRAPWDVPANWRI